jgi:large subunit ribosomal protein L28e
MASPDLQWEILRQTNNRFLLKRSGVTLSTEPGNLLNLNSKKYSGLVNDKAIHIGFPSQDGAALAVSFKTKNGHYSKPSEFSAKKGCKNSNAAINSYIMNSVYRVDLARAANARVCAIFKAQQPRRERKQKMRANKLARLTRKSSA